MPGYERRASIRQDPAAIFNMVCDLETPEEWAQWLRVPLGLAARTGNSDLVDKLLKAGADVSAGFKGCNDQTLLHAAAEGGNEEVLSAFLRAEAKEDINTKTQATGRTPLHLAVRAGKVAAADALMLAGARANVLDAKKEAPLHLAIRGGHGGVAKNLLLHGADPDLRALCGRSPLQLAARRGQDAVVRNLLHAGAQVNRLSYVGWTALGSAVACNHLSTVEVLLGKGADVTIPCQGDTPLHLAVMLSDMNILSALVEAGAGADIEARNVRRQTPLHASMFRSTCAGTLALLQLGANVHAIVPATGSTPLHLACKKGNLGAACLLLAWGADETAIDKNGRTPSDRIPNIAEAAEQDRPRLERLSKVLSDPHDRAWRRRGMLVMCRAHPDRLRLAVEIPDTAEAIGQPQGRPSRRARRSQVKVEVTMGGARNGVAGGAVSSAVGGSGGRRAAREGSGCDGGGGFDGVAAWLMALREEGVFRKIVAFL